MLRCQGHAGLGQVLISKLEPLFTSYDQGITLVIPKRKRLVKILREVEREIQNFISRRKIKQRNLNFFQKYIKIEKLFYRYSNDSQSNTIIIFKKKRFLLLYSINFRPRNSDLWICKFRIKSLNRERLPQVKKYFQNYIPKHIRIIGKVFQILIIFKFSKLRYDNEKLRKWEEN